MLSPVPVASFERLGGGDTLTRAVALLFARLKAAPALQPLLYDGSIPANSAEVERQVRLWLTDRLGGPMSYDGPDVAGLCRQLQVDSERWNRLVRMAGDALLAAGAPSSAVDEARVLLLAALPVREGTIKQGPVGSEPKPDAVALRQAAEAVVVAAGLSGWNLFVLDPDLVLIHEDEAASAALVRCDADLRRAFGLGATELLGKSVLRFHPAPSQFQGLLSETARLSRDTTWCFGRVAWRARVFVLSAAGPGRPGFAIVWRDESEAYRREAIITRLKAQAEELPIPVMYPDAEGELWFGNAACAHALARLAPWLPPHLNLSNGIHGALFFPEAAERQSLFTAREALPLKKRMTFGPETVSLLVTAVCDDDQQMLCPQVTWEIVHSIAPVVMAPAPPPPSGGRVPPEGATQPRLHPRPRNLTEASSDLRREARALETSALALSWLGGVLDALADQAAGAGAGLPTAELERAVAAALGQLNEIARPINRVVGDASLSVVEDSMTNSVGMLLDRTASVRAAVDDGAGVLAPQAHDVARQLAQAVATAGRLVELRDAVPAPDVLAAEVVLA